MEGEGEGEGVGLESMDDYPFFISIWEPDLRKIGTVFSDDI